MNRNRRIAIIALSPILFLVLCLLYKGKVRQKNTQEAIVHQQQLITEWKSAEFEPIGSEHNISQGFRGFVKGQGLSKEQEDKLVDSILTCLRAYSHDSFDTYVKFRYPMPITAENSAWDPRELSAFREVLNSKNIKIPEGGDAQAKNMALLKEFYKLAAAAPNGKNNQSLCIHCWQGINLSKSGVKIQYNQAADEPISTWVWEDKNESSTAVASALSYNPSLILEKSKKPTAAWVRFLIKAEALVNAYPVYVNFLWSDSANCWVPDEFLIPLAGLGENGFLF